MADPTARTEITFGSGAAATRLSVLSAVIRDLCPTFSVLPGGICPIAVDPAAAAAFLAALEQNRYEIPVALLEDVRRLAESWGCRDLLSAVTRAFALLPPERQAIIRLISAARDGRESDVDAAREVIVANLDRAMAWAEFARLPPAELATIRASSVSTGEVLARSLIRSGGSWADITQSLSRSGAALLASHVFDLRQLSREEAAIPEELAERAMSMPEALAREVERRERLARDVEEARAEVERARGAGARETIGVPAEEIAALEEDLAAIEAEIRDTAQMARECLRPSAEAAPVDEPAIKALHDEITLDLDRLEFSIAFPGEEQC